VTVRTRADAVVIGAGITALADRVLALAPR
jgi:hypothetical protein